MSTEFVVGAFACALAAVVAWDWWRSRGGAPPGERVETRAHRTGVAGGGAPGAPDGGSGGDGCGGGGGDGGGDGGC